MKDPRIEAAARALYSDVNRNHSTTKGWDEVRPRWQDSYRSNARAVIEAIDTACIITTVEELDKLPIGSRVAGQKDIFERVQTTGNQWLNVSGDYFNGYSGIIPARVLYWGTK